jgi:hypothetical protein
MLVATTDGQTKEVRLTRKWASVVSNLQSVVCEIGV